MKEEFYDITFRKKIYTSLEELQKDADEWIRKYNGLRLHSGKYCYGKTPMQTFLDAKHLAKDKQLDILCIENCSVSSADLVYSQDYHEAKYSEFNKSRFTSDEQV